MLIRIFKKIYILLSVIFIMAASSCGPNTTKEGVTLDPLTFPFNVDKDTGYIRMGDTVRFSSIVPNSNHLNDGTLDLKVSIGFFDSIPITNPSLQVHEIHSGIDYIVIEEYGSVNYNQSVSGLMLGFTTEPKGDSIRLSYKIIFLRKGVYQLSIQSSFYQGTKSKARTEGFFNVVDPHWSLYQIAGYENSKPSDADYRGSYLVGVVD